MENKSLEQDFARAEERLGGPNRCNKVRKTGLLSVCFVSRGHRIVLRLFGRSHFSTVVRPTSLISSATKASMCGCTEPTRLCTATERILPNIHRTHIGKRLCAHKTHASSLTLQFTLTRRVDDIPRVSFFTVTTHHVFLRSCLPPIPGCYFRDGSTIPGRSILQPRSDRYTCGLLTHTPSSSGSVPSGQS